MEVEKTFCHPQSIVQSATSPVPNTIDDAIHISSDTGTLSPIKMTDGTPQNTAQCSSPTNISDSPALPTSNDWKTNVALTLNDKEELISGQWLSDKCINAALHLLKSQFPSQNGLQDTLILEKYKKYSSSSNNFVQIIHIPNHWVCASNQFSPDGGVDVYDSIPAYSANAYSLKYQLAAILKCKQASFTVRHVNVQRQLGGNDCGLFAISFATSLCMGFDPHTRKYYQTEMHNHFYECIENNKMTEFPSAPKKQRLVKTKFISQKKVTVYCICRLPWNKTDSGYGSLVQCKLCKEWYHQTCCNINSKNIETAVQKYLCYTHVQNDCS